MAGRIKKCNSFSILSDWLEQLAELNIRGLLILCKEHLRKDQQAPEKASLVQSFEHIEQKLGKALSLEGSLNESRIDDYLGTERAFTLYDAETNFDANTFCGISGTVKGGGVLAVLLSKSDFESHKKSIQSKNAEKDSLSEVSVNNTDLLQRFLSFSISSPSTALLDGYKLITYSHNSLNHSSSRELKRHEGGANTEQDLVVEQIVKVSQGHSRRPLVITADRGRGKSAALGIAASKLMTNKAIKLIITAPKISALDSVFLHLSSELEAKGLTFKSSKSRSGKLKSITTANGSSIEYMPVDKIIRENPSCQTLMIDEAAAISVNALQELNQRYNRMVFATTVHGYEGSGQGFDIRFRKHLLKKRPQTRFSNLTKPIRWADNDYLEKDLFNSFLLNVDLQNLPSDLISNVNDLRLEQVATSSLLSNELSLKRIFALLVNAHYQTRPADLHRLLSDKNLRIYVLSQADYILGVCLVNSEGNLSEKESDEISHRNAQIRGHLLPQSVISRYGLTQFGLLKTARIMRIAVHPQLQSRGLGSRFIKLIREQINGEFDFIGASFGATEEVCHYWLKNGFQPIGIGTAKDTASGDFNLEVLCPLNASVNSVLDLIKSRFANLFRFNLNKIYSCLSPQLTSMILTAIFKSAIIQIKPDDLVEIRRFCLGQRAVSQVGDLLCDFYIQISESITDVLTSEEREFIVSYLFKNWSEENTARYFNLTGKKEIQNKLRALFSRLLENN